MPNKTQEYLNLAQQTAKELTRYWENWTDYLTTASRLYKYNYAFIIATHTDREHIHNHIIYNSTALDSTRKFRDFLLSGLAVQRLSDLICLEHQLSVIEIKPYRERQKRTLYPPRESNRDKLCAVIDNILLSEKPASFEGFLQKLEQRGYEIKRGKYTSVKGTRQKRFIRFRTLGAGYSEDEIKAVIAGDAEHCPHQKQPPKEKPFNLLVDVQAKLAEGKNIGYSNSRHSRSASDKFGLITESKESGRTWRIELKMSKEGFCFPFSILAIYFTETLLFSASCSCVIFIAFRTAFICFPKAIASAFGIIITSIVLYRSCGKNGITSSFQ